MSFETISSPPFSGSVELTACVFKNLPAIFLALKPCRTDPTAPAAPIPTRIPEVI